MSRLERISDAEITTQADEAHVHDGGGTGEDVASDVDGTPGDAKGPLT